MMLIALSTMLLTTACSSDNDVITNNENINKKGYEIPVTLNATRQGDATTRATYNPDTRMLEYSTGDQLYVLGNHSTAGMFYGTLEWKGGIIFSGTITTTNQYEGTGVDLLSSSKWVRAILLPAGYNNYHYITINNPGFSGHPYAAFATSKATAIEQFSNESASGYNNGFELLPQNAILNFTITGLTPNTEFAVELWNSYYSLVEGNVTTNGSGTATFAIGIDISMCKAPATTVDIDDLYNKGWDLRIKDNNNDYVLRMYDDNNPLVTSSKPLVAGKIYNITRSAAAASAAVGHPLPVSVLGEVVGTDGLAYALADKSNLPTGVTAAGVVAYKSGENGLVIALTDKTSWNQGMDWYTAVGASGAAAHTPTVSGYSWKLPSKVEWNNMFAANGGNAGSYTGLNTTITTAGGMALWGAEYGDYYWSSTEYIPDIILGELDSAADVYLDEDGTVDWTDDQWKGYTSRYVRACIAF